METAIPALIVIMLLVTSMLTLVHGYLSAQDAMQESWREMEERMGERMRTQISGVGAGTTDLGATVVVTLTNQGETKLADFDHWDVILEYKASDDMDYTEWYSYGVGTNQWQKTIYLEASTATAEVFDTGILDPGEEIAIRVSVTPTVKAGTTNWATIATPNGVRASRVFTG